MAAAGTNASSPGGIAPPASDSFENVWDTDKEAMEWWTRISSGKKSVSNHELCGHLIRYLKLTRGQDWPPELIRSIVTDCIDLRTPEGSVDSTEFRCYINMWGPFKNSIDTITKSLYDENGDIFPYWAGKKGREHRFVNIGDYIIRFATSRNHLAASWKKVKAGNLVIKHVAIWRCPKGFYWVPQRNGPFVGYFKNLRDLVRDFDHTLRNPGCSEIWYEAKLKPWYEDRSDVKEDNSKGDNSSSKNMYATFNDTVIDRAKEEAAKLRKKLAEATLSYYRKYKRDEHCYAWDSACSPTVFGGYFRAMLPSRALGVESTARLDSGFSNEEFDRDRRARESITLKPMESKSLDELKKEKAENPYGTRMRPPPLSKANSSESCLNLFENIDEDSKAPTVDRSGSIYRRPPIRSSRGVTSPSKSTLGFDFNFSISRSSSLTLVSEIEKEQKAEPPNMYRSLTVGENATKNDPSIASPRRPVLNGEREGKSGSATRNGSNNTNNQDSVYQAFIDRPHTLEQNQNEPTHQPSLHSGLIVDAKPTNNGKKLGNREDGGDSIYTAFVVKPTLSRPATYSPRANRVEFRRKRYAFRPFNLEVWSQSHAYSPVVGDNVQYDYLSSVQ